MEGWLGAERSGRLAGDHCQIVLLLGVRGTAVGCQRYCCWVSEVLLLGVRGNPCNEHNLSLHRIASVSRPDTSLFEVQKSELMTFHVIYNSYLK